MAGWLCWSGPFSSFSPPSTKDSNFGTKYAEDVRRIGVYCSNYSSRITRRLLFEQKHTRLEARGCCSSLPRSSSLNPAGMGHTRTTGSALAGPTGIHYLSYPGPVIVSQMAADHPRPPPSIDPRGMRCTALWCSGILPLVHARRHGSRQDGSSRYIVLLRRGWAVVLW